MRKKTPKRSASTRAKRARPSGRRNGGRMVARTVRRGGGVRPGASDRLAARAAERDLLQRTPWSSPLAAVVLGLLDVPV